MAGAAFEGPYLPPPPAEPTASSPELLQDLRALRGWYEEANRLELQIAQLSAKVQQNDQHLVVARRQAAEARTRRAHAAQSLPKLSRARREVATRSSAMASALQAELDNNVQRTKGNHGLLRSLQRLHQRLGHTVGYTDSIEQVMRQEAELEEVARVEEDTLKQTIDGMGDVQERLKSRVAEERDKRVQLREAARGKLERVEKSQAGLKEKMDEHNEAVAAIKERLSEQEERTRAAQQALSLSREAARGAYSSVEGQQQARRAMHSELLGVQRAHESLRADLEMTLSKLEEMSERDSKAQQSWRLQHMERLDARIRVQQDLDQDVLIEDTFLNARAGGC